MSPQPPSPLRSTDFLFPADAPKPAAIWRLQTFRVAKIDLSPGVLHDILAARLPALTGLIAPSPSPLPTALLKLLEGGRLFGRMMHGTRDSSGGFYKAFLPSFGEPLDNARVGACPPEATTDAY